MQVTNVELDLAQTHKVLRAYAKVTFDDVFVVHGIRLIEKEGILIACMPNRKRWLDCTECRVAVAILDDYCGRCGNRQPPIIARMEQLRYELGCAAGDDHVRPFLDVCHPITRSFREAIESAVVTAYWSARDGPTQTAVAGHDARGTPAIAGQIRPPSCEEAGPAGA